LLRCLARKHDFTIRDYLSITPCKLKPICFIYIDGGLKPALQLKIRVSVVRFRPWAPPISKANQVKLFDLGEKPVLTRRDEVIEQMMLQMNEL
jgi:hypothetical protein